MPMQLTISRNRKTSENYNSEGHGVSLTVEVDQGMLTRPAELQRQIDQLYREADVRSILSQPDLIYYHLADVSIRRTGTRAANTSHAAQLNLLA